MALTDIFKTENQKFTNIFLGKQFRVKQNSKPRTKNSVYAHTGAGITHYTQ